MNCHIVVLAAGMGSRMNSGHQKVLLDANGLSLLEYALRTAAGIAPLTTSVVVGHAAEEVGRHLTAWPEVNVVLQEQARGPLHALAKTEALLWDADGPIVVLPAAMPAMTPDLLAAALRQHQGSGAAVTLVAGMCADPWGFDFSVSVSPGQDIELCQTTERWGSGPVGGFSGLSIFSRSAVFGVATEGCRANPENADFSAIPAAAAALDVRVDVWHASDADELRAARTRVELMRLGRLLQTRRCQALLRAGVSLVDPDTTYVGADVVVGRDTVLHPNTTLDGRTTIGQRCVVHGGCRLVGARLGDEVTILDHTVIVDSAVETGASVGPFAHLRPGCVVGQRARVGNFVELKKTTLGVGSKANHLSYLGDSTVGARVNIGAGTITCNYDGVNKHQTVIEDDVFIGSDSQLVAPVRIEQGAYVAAGSSITKSVPAGALGIARSRQENKPGWVARARENRPSRKHG